MSNSSTNCISAVLKNTLGLEAMKVCDPKVTQPNFCEK